MADLQKTVEIIFGGRNELSKTIGQVETSLDSLHGASQPFADLADNVLRAEGAVLALGVAFAGLSISQAGKFGDQFAEITTLIDANVSDLGGYRKEIINYAQDSTQSLDSIIGAVYSAISAGVDYTAALGATSDAEKLAVAGKADLKSSLVALASTLNAYGAETSQAADYSDIFFTIVKQGQTTLPELATSLSQVTNTAAAAGVPFDDLGAALAALTASGMPTTQAVTAIKAALSNIIKPSKDAQETAAALGIEFNATALKTQGLQGFMQTLEKATGGNVETMGHLFGSVEGLNGVMALAADKSGIFAKSLEAMETRSGATDAAFKKMVDNFGLNNQKLVNNIQTVLIGVGSKLLDDYGDVVDSLVATLQGIGTAVDKGDLDGLVGIFESALGDINGLLEGLAKSLPEALAGIDWSGLSGSLDNLKGSLGDAFGAVFGSIDLGTVDGVRSAIQTVVDLLSGLTNVSAGVIDGMRPLFVALGTLADNFAGAGTDGQEFAGQILGIGKSVNVITGFLSGATDALGGLGKGLLLIGGSSVINSVLGLVKVLGGGNGLAGVIGSAASGSGALLSSLAGPAGVIAVVTASAAAVTGAVKTYNEWQDAEDEAATAADLAAASAAKLTEKYQEISEATGVTITSTRDLQTALADGKIHFDEATHSWQAGVAPLKDFSAEVHAAAEASYDYRQELKGMLDENGNIASVITGTTRELDLQKQSLIEYYEYLGNSPTVARVMAEAETTKQDALQATTNKLDTAKKKTEEYQLKLEEIASNERIKTIELAVNFNTEKIKAEAEIFKSTFDSIDTSIESTGNLLGSLNGQLNDFAGGNRRVLLDQIDAENRRRDQAFDEQKKLTDAQASYYEARTKALNSGDALIRVDATTLVPESHALALAVMRAVQEITIEDKSQFLVAATI